VIFDQFYSSPKSKGMMDTRFLGQIDGPFICLTVAIICHSLQYLLSGINKDKVAFTRSNGTGKIKNTELRFSTVSGYL